ncbi:hypothetical protein BX611_1681 [Lutibacter oceani]|uniref:Uncharacterized protein n=1 Tax=Lutibacter oceani TaxID=1853311 RepID=A0A3D9RRM1_9FLAO|nr:hypothetical protein [Lutibacter oceani]REE82138.1 hypothetical protein BX611_1681 [Lutibacter oceani]
MYNFTDLIAKSYIEYTIRRNDNIAHFFYYNFLRFTYSRNSKPIFGQNEFFKLLINEINSLINITYSSNQYIEKFEDKYFETIRLEKDFESYERSKQKEDQLIADDLGFIGEVKRNNWEKCTNAKELIKALENGLILSDPITFISEIKEIQSGDLVLRKSKLEYLKSEAERASDAESIEDLDTNVSSTTILIKSNSDTETFIKVNEAFRFTLTDDPWQKKQILSHQDYNSLVIWVTEYFEKSFTIPEIKEPIKKLYTAKGNIVQAFKDLFAELHPSLSKSKPESYFKLISSCFVLFSDKTRKQIDGAKPSKDYDYIVKKIP